MINVKRTYKPLLLKEHYVLLSLIKGELHPLPKIFMFCALFQNYQPFFEKIIYAPYSKLSKELKNSIKIVPGQAVLELLIKTIFWLFDQ